MLNTEGSLRVFLVKIVVDQNKENLHPIAVKNNYSFIKKYSSSMDGLQPLNRGFMTSIHMFVFINYSLFIYYFKCTTYMLISPSLLLFHSNSLERAKETNVCAIHRGSSTNI